MNIPLLNESQSVNFKDILDMMMDDGKQLLEDVVAGMGDVADRAEGLLLTGVSPATELAKLIEQRNYDLVIIGNRGLSGVQEYMGSVSHKVLHGSTAPGAHREVALVSEEAVRTRKNVLLLFSKPPAPGLVKTRLTTLKDGVFAPEVASALYHCMLFDVVEICCAALATLEARAAGADAGAAAAMAAGAEEATETRAAGNPRRSVPASRCATNTSWSSPPRRQRTWTSCGSCSKTQALGRASLVLIADEGASFDEHYNHAFAQAWERGADAVLSMGADMPALTTADVIGGFEALHRLDGVPGGGIVLAPDQEMGVSIVGWTRATAFDHAGVFYNQEGLTVLPAYIAKARERNLPALYLPAVPDVDTMADLMHNVTLVEALNYCAAFDGNTPPWRTADALAQMGWSEVRVPPNDLHDPREEIDR